MLAVGSDDGFPVHQGDEGLVRAYAAILSTVEPKTGRASSAIARTADIAQSALNRIGRLTVL